MGIGFFLVLGQRKTLMHIPFFPYSFGSRKAGLSCPLALCESHYELVRQFSGNACQGSQGICIHGQVDKCQQSSV